MAQEGSLMYITDSLFPELQPEHRTRIYFGLGVAEDQVKIGLTGRKDGRRGGEMHFTELCAVPGDRRTEDFYHAKYTSDRIGKTEWFRLSDQLLIDLTVMCVQQGRSRSVEILKKLTLTRLHSAAAA